MAKNHGKETERDFETILLRQGKAAYFHRLVDAAYIYGLVGEASDAPPQPSDYVAVIKGRTQFAEVKSTENKTSFPFSLLRIKQSSAATQILAAGGDYLIYIKALSLPNQPWFAVDYRTVRVLKDLGQASIKWGDLPRWEI